MTKADLIAVIAEKLKFPWARAEVLVDQVFEAMVDALKRGEGIEIRGFGSFTIRQYKAYEGRNPRTGETVQVKPKRLAFFKVGKELRERVNDGRAEPEPVSASSPSEPAVATQVAVAGKNS
jgi:integration host factor subunit beta